MRCFEGNALGPVQNKTHTKMSSYLTLPWAQPDELIISTRERGPENAPLWAERQRHGPCPRPKTHLSQILPGNYDKGIPARGSCCCFYLWWKFFLVIFYPCPPHTPPLSDKHPDTATTSSNCPGISIASSPHDLSTFNLNFIPTVPKLQTSIMMLPHS